MKHSILISLMLTFSACGQVPSGITTQFKLNGPELMETTYCAWVEPMVGATLTMDEYSDGKVTKQVFIQMPGLKEYNTIPFNDQAAIYYVYEDRVGMLHQGSLVGDDTVCTHTFYTYQ